MGNMEITMKNKWQKIKNFYSLYTSGLNHKEIERILKKDTLDAIEYYKKKANLEEGESERSRFRKFLYLLKELFISFLMKLTPARRLVYGVGLIVFVIGLMGVNVKLLIISFLGMNFLLALELADKLTTRDELEIAREIQVGLQPEKIPEIPFLSISTFSKPAKLVGGDFFDIVKPADDRMISIVGDVSGKGIPAAIYAAHIQSMFESLSEKTTSPSDIIYSIDDLLSKRLRDGHFITAVIAYFNLIEKSMTIARAGHNWPLYYSSRTKKITPLKTKGISIGLYGEYGAPNMLEEQKIFLNDGDILLLYSDGITEAINPQKHMFDLSGLEKALRESAHESTDKIIAKINYRLDQFVQTEELHDDATIMAIKSK